VVCSDEVMLHADPHRSRDAWCHQRVALTAARLERCDAAVPLVLVNHFPLIEAPTWKLRHPEFAQWCGPRSLPTGMTWHDGVRCEEVSLGYPHEWERRGGWPGPSLIAA
jgi:hypothetical protein